MRRIKLKRNFIYFFVSLFMVASAINFRSYAITETLIGGADRIETSIKIAEKYKNIDTVILASGEQDKIIDSLVFGPLSNKLNAPIVLNTGVSLSKKVEAFFEQSGVKKVIIAGGTNSISKKIENSIIQKGVSVERIYGEDRVDTSIRVREKLGNVKGIFVVGRNSISDAISISPVSCIENYAILVFDKKIKNSGIDSNKITVIGGESSVSNNDLKAMNYVRVSGVDRNDTNRKIISTYLNSFDGNKVFIASSEDSYLVDGLVAGPYASKSKSPIIFGKKSYDVYIRAKKSSNLEIVFVGKRVINNGTKSEITGKNAENNDEKAGFAQNAVSKFYAVKPSDNNRIDNDKNDNKAEVKNDEDKESIGNKDTELEKTTGLPVRFDLRNVNGNSYVTTVKNQFYDGGCRSFASMAALESHIKMKEGVELDLSENNMENRHGFSFKDKGRELNVREGRNRESDLSYFISGRGPILEADDKYIPIRHDFVPAPYLNDKEKSLIEDMSREYKTEIAVRNEAKNPVVKKPVRQVLGFEFLKTVDNSKIASNDDILMKQIKEAIKNNGAVVSNIYMAHDGNKTFPYSNSSTYNSEKKAYSSLDYNANPNHAIAIVGWDDNFSKENFPAGNRPDIDGAWIVKDSQTEYFGDKGYFFVSYKSSGICSDAYVFTDVRNTDEFKGVYQYDDYAFTGFVSPDKYGDKTILFNKYSISENNQIMDSVGFYTTKPNAEYEVYYINNFDKYSREFNEEQLEDVEDIDNKLEEDKTKILSGKMEKAGYHTLKIPQEYIKELKKGDKIALGIYVKNDDKEDPKHEWDMVVEKNDKSNPNVNHGKNAKIGKGETFVLTNLMDSYYEFVDINNMNENINACVKLYFK
ncbi:cell wall-binding repeat-containing protein [Peptostreptococcus sp. D1]|uniref:cell wall-binding repeat-containing protein n=1 Tax=Peptostreptococcus sp. D1 TaxID=72304 RepID=UPI0008EC0CD8|nr:cell wall-binding repeat-containing protein [Peptostreptococcus sp. D1]SFE61132.1 Cysteine protease, C1A family [Peptostreptococcus sp. D1]